MKRKITGFVTALLIATATGACVSASRGSSADSVSTPAREAVVTGSALYRERISPPPGATIHFSLNNVSLADAPSVLIAEQSYALDGKGPPYTFRLVAPRGKLSPRMRYSVQVEIRDAGGALLWISDTSNPIDPAVQEQELPMIVLVKTG